MPTKEEILRLLDRLEYETADDLENETLEFKPWEKSFKDNRKLATEYAVCFANAKGGTVVFGVSDRVKGRKKAIHGCKDYSIDTFKNSIYDTTTPSMLVNIEELIVPEGTLLLVHIPAADADTTYGTKEGLYRIRQGKSCRGLPPTEHRRRRMSIGAIDWSAELVEGAKFADLDSLEIERYRNTLRLQKPESDLLRFSNEQLVKAVRAIEDGKICNAGILMFARKDVLARFLPQHEVIFVAHKSPTEIFTENHQGTVLAILERLSELLLLPMYNPTSTLNVDLFKFDVQRFPVEVLREALLNAIVHRDYTETGPVYVRLENEELIFANPGGFIAGITPDNILTHEARQRNKRLAEMVEKSELVERAGVGRRRIFIPMLSFGKRIPRYSADEHSVSLKLFGRMVNEKLALYSSKRSREGVEFGIDELIVLNDLVLKDSIDVSEASKLCQRDESEMRLILDELASSKRKLLERRGKKSGITYHLERSVAVELLGKARYSRIRDIEEVRFPEMVKRYVELHDSISNRECRELLNLGDSDTAIVKASRLLTALSKSNGFLDPVGGKHRGRRYNLRAKNEN